ncbi:AraC family transcriptional regulator [Pontimicrobium sp. SW4]|uniref:AraC family transcriptional regulator n=1 Tax=Pontimicrobium sp. SW4 TaxID=3153519 RepID=A0AAU7BQ21_9FLAO
MTTILNFNVFNIFMISATVLGLLFSSVLLCSKRFKNKPSKYLNYTILLISINNLYYWFISTNLWVALGWKCYKSLFISWDLLILPMYMYFVASYFGKSLKNAKYYKYPFFITVIVHVFIVVGDFTNESFFKDYGKVIYIYDLLTNYFSLLFAVFVVYKIFKLIFDYEKEIKNNSKNTITAKTKWLKQLLIASLAFSLLSMIILIYKTANTKSSIYIDSPINDDFMWAILSIFVYWLCYAGIYHVGIFNQRQDLRVKLVSEKITLNFKPYNGSIDKFNDIDSAIKKERLYTNPSISLQTIALRFNISEGYVSQLVNKHTNTNFSTYINSLRIVEAQRILTNVNYKNYTIVAIALESGFNSKSAFYSAFKKSAGISPLEYKKQHNIS